MRTNYRIPLVLGILIVAVNIIAFAVPVEKNATFYLCDAFVVIALVAQLGICWLAFGKNKSLRSKVYGWPIMRIGLLYLSATFIISICLILIPAMAQLFSAATFAIFLLVILAGILIAMVLSIFSFRVGVAFMLLVALAGGLCYYLYGGTQDVAEAASAGVPIWIGIVLFVACTAAAAIGLVATTAIRDSVESKLDAQVTDTAAMVQMRSQAETLCKATTDPKISRLVRRVADELKYSDPVSSETTQSYDENLQRMLSDISTAVAKNDATELTQLTTMFQLQLASRNQACKMGKAAKR